MAPLPVVLALAVERTTTTEEVRRIVGDPLPTWAVLGAGLAVLVAIVVAGVAMNRRQRRQKR